MQDKLTIALAQTNMLVGDVSGNFDKVCEYLDKAKAARADLVVFPELALSGYPPEDLLFREGFIADVDAYLEQLAGLAQGIGLVIGFPRQQGDKLYNAAVFLSDGKTQLIYDKQVLPNYGVFDEKRYFTAGNGDAIFEYKGIKLGLSICEDIWHAPPVKSAIEAGAQLILNLNASPFHINKPNARQRMLAQRCREYNVGVIYVNLVGGQDELVFDGHSMAFDHSGEQVYQACGFEETLGVVQIDAGLERDSQTGVAIKPIAAHSDAVLAQEAMVYQALVLAVKDYVTKNGFNGVVLGLSGGVDSALTLAIAADALGASQVEAIMMPSAYTSQMSLEDAAAIANNFGVLYEEISIESAVKVLQESLQVSLAGYPADTTEENIQARCRGLMLMAVSNKKRKLVLATGNKSEMAVGYATLYGDMVGGFAPLKDVNKTWVYKLCQYRNLQGEVIPARIINRPPSAELAPDQKDEDSLPPYDVLDPLLELYLEQEQSVESIIAAGFSAEVVRDITRKVNINEYKRRQAAPGVKISKRAFGRERRYPITCGYKR